MTEPLASRGESLPTVTGVVAALAAASCCLLPLGLIVLGVVNAGLMMTMMRYEWFTLPLGVLGLIGAYSLYRRNRRRCDAAGCRMVGQRSTQVILAIATIIVVVALLLRVFPSWTAGLLEQL